MSAPLLVRGARQLLTLRGPSSPRLGLDAHDLAVIPDGSLLLRGELIHQAGPTRRVDNLAEARHADVIDATGLVVLPGFVDPHAHLFGQTPTRVSLAKTVERFIRHGTTALCSATHSRRASKVFLQLKAPLTVVDGPLPNPPASPIEWFRRREKPPLAEPFVFASGFHSDQQPASNLQTVFSLACLEYGLSPEQAITAITFNAACAIGLSARIGSLEPDKQADILLLDVPEYHEIPYHFGVNLVRGVIQRGRVVYWRGEIEWTDKS